MSAMAGRGAHLAAIAVLGLAGCGSDPPPMPDACLGEPAAFARALELVPGQVRLAGGTSLSRCVTLARRDGDLEGLGLVLTRVVDELRPRAARDPAVALRLGYVAGAVRRGAASTTGLAAQLARRVELSATLGIDGARERAALQRGISLGEAGG
ncbi:MAG: hypothetical protein QOJ35_960 [Solirubrobacteraceae bacterium]|jgi:hypothetical protein|nr:hypothetical protein [Solirubrobacteraceae bacterium]